MSARKALTPVEQDEYLRAVGTDLLRAAPDDWVKLRLVYAGLGTRETATLDVLFEGGRSTGWVPPLSALERLRALRAGMHARGTGTWYTAYYEVERPGSYRVRYDYDGEPHFDDPGDAAGYALELERFPRDDERVPDWLWERLEGGDRVPDAAAESSPYWGLATAPRPAPGAPMAPGGMSPEEMMDTVQEIVDLTLAAVHGQWSELVIEYRGLVAVSSARVRVRRTDGSAEWDLLLPEVGRLLDRLRTGMYQAGKGTWFTARFTVNASREIEAHFDHDAPPEFGCEPDPRSFHQDIQRFPRSADHLPDWLLDRLSLAQRMIRAGR
ncbi:MULTISPECIES: hypothetical protein [unclassified Nocardiopsis]|uniref:hypothetical protein n=1 Tax=unclassified Nocardiopsis TaxID=2649073 RepID=UPI00135BBDF2|nr:MULTISPECIES: hypothetical protein [unclassified Nocardiopsis]